MKVPTPKQKVRNVFNGGREETVYCPHCNCASCNQYNEKMHHFKKSTLLNFMKNDKKLVKLYKAQLMKMVKDAPALDDTDEKMLMDYLAAEQAAPAPRDPTPLSDELSREENFPVTQA